MIFVTEGSELKPDRRQFLAAVGSAVSVVSVSGCLGILPTGGGNPRYPAGTVVVENAANHSLSVSITVVEDGYDATLETSVAAGETYVHREFVTAEAGDVVTLAARLDDTGEPTTFEILPAGSENNFRPEVARLTIHNAVEASAQWTAERGTQ
ncbi:MAG: hypothetical protein ACOCQY_03140 [Halorhabdus sp.]